MKAKKNKNKSKVFTSIKVIFVILVVLIIGGVVVVKKFMNNNDANFANTNIDNTVTERVQKRDIELKLIGTGALKPANSYDVTSLVSGEVVKSYINIGDIVKKDQELYCIDNKNAMNELEKSNLNIKNIQKKYNKLIKDLDYLNVKSSIDGVITNVNVIKGETISNGQVLATVVDKQNMIVKLPYVSKIVDEINIGDKAKVIVDGSYEKIDGKVIDINNIETVLEGNRIVKYITLEVKNPGAITTKTKANAIINDTYSIEQGKFDYKHIDNIKSKLNGKVSKILFKEGDIVSSSSIILNIKSEQLQEDIESNKSLLDDALLSLKTSQDKLNSYIIKSPINGTIIEKLIKTSDKLEVGKILCKIFDLSYLTMHINVDESDIMNVKVGQKVSIKSSIYKDKVYEGEVCRVSINGTTNNQSTTYPVTIKLKETEGLLPGMNVTATIITCSKKGVLTVPISAVERGNKVLVKTDSKEINSETGLSGSKYVDVEVGISNKEYVEILSGLKENDEIIINGSNLPSINLNDNNNLNEYMDDGAASSGGSW